MEIKKKIITMKIGAIFSSTVLGLSTLALTTTPIIANAQANSVYSTNCLVDGTETGSNAYSMTCGSTSNSTFTGGLPPPGTSGSIAAGSNTSASFDSVLFGISIQDHGNYYNYGYGLGNNFYDANNAVFGSTNTIGSLGTNATGVSIYNSVVGFNSTVTGSYDTYSGSFGNLSGNYDVASGYQVNVSSDYAVAFGYKALVSGTNSVAIGNNAQATDANSIALGANSNTDGRTYEVSIGNTSGAAFNRVLTGLAPGVNTNDAVNVGQLNIVQNSLTALYGGHAALVQAVNAVYNSLGGGASLDTGTLAYTTPVFTLAGTNYTTVSSALQALETQVSSVSSGGSTTTDSLAVHYNSASLNSVTFTNLSLVGNVQAGISNTDAMNVGQGQALAQALGGGAVFTSGILSGPIYTLNGTSYNNVGSALLGLQSEINSISSSSGGSTSSTDANALHYDNGAGSGSVTINGTGQIHGVQAGTSSTDAANVGQVQAAITTSEQYTDQQIQNVTTKANPLAVNYTDANKSKVQLNQNNQNVTVSGVADGVDAHDAVNVEQLNATLNSANNYTNQQVNNLQNTMTQQYNAVNGRIDNLDKKVDGVAAMALSSGNVQFGNAYEQNQLSVGVASFRGAVGGTLSYTRKFNDNLVGNLGVSGATNAGGVGFAAKMGYSW